MRPCLLLLLILSLNAPLATAIAEPASETDSTEWLIAVRPAAPFVLVEGEAYSGLAVELFAEIAAEQGWRYRFEAVSLRELLDGVAAGRYAVGLGALTVNAEREARLDFSHPLSSSGLTVAVPHEGRAGWQSVASALLSPAFLRIAVGLCLLLLVLGTLVWLAERRRNAEQFGGSAADGIASGFWWAAVTMTTVGYGDKAPVTLVGRLLALVWMIAALVVVSTFTAAITSALTVGQLNSHIQGVKDLPGKRLLAIADSTGAAWLARQGLQARLLPDLDAALAELSAGKADAVIHDEPLLRWSIARHHATRLRVLPLILERQDYAFALPAGSPWRETLSRGVLQRIAEPRWRDRLANFSVELR